MIPSLGLVIGLPVGLLLSVFAIVVGRWGIRWGRMPGNDSDAVLGGRVLIGLGIAGLMLTAGLMWPWTLQYHSWTTVSGVVTETPASRFIASDTKGGGTTQRFVVTLAGVGQRSCDDTRCAEVHKGDRLTLSCKREWQYAGTPGWSCGFVEVR